MTAPAPESSPAFEPFPPEFVRAGGAPGEPVFSVVCASNDAGVLRDWLLRSLRAQTVPWELRVVDAGAEGFGGAAEALNAGAAGARGSHLLFAHQDVVLEGETFLAEAERHLAALGPAVGAAGPVGAAPSGHPRGAPFFSDLHVGPARARWSGVRLDAPREVQTLDEMLIIVPRDAFAEVRFDPDACGGWHLYGVDLCLSVAHAGRKVFALPLAVHHLSGGALDDAYYHTLARVTRKHRDHVRRIHTTSEVWPTRMPGRLQRAWHRAKVAGRIAARVARRRAAAVDGRPSEALPR